jgi:hypothetical protein
MRLSYIHVTFLLGRRRKDICISRFIWCRICNKNMFAASHEIICTRFARWFCFKPKIPNSGKFGGPWNGKCNYILWPFGILHSHLVLLVYFWYSSWSRQIWQPWFALKRELQKGGKIRVNCFNKIALFDIGNN